MFVLKHLCQEVHEHFFFSESPVFASCEESVPTFTLLSVELLTILFSLETILLTSLLMAETILLIMVSV